MFSRRVLQSIVIDSTSSFTELCELGKNAGIDKSPYNQHTYRHPYTSVYSMLFGPLKNKEIQFAEIGVGSGGSVILWNQYFTNPSTRFRFFDYFENALNNSRSLSFPIPRSTFDIMDVCKDGDIARALSGSGLYDVIIDDSTHSFGDQIRIIKEAIPFIKPGGYMIVEDIYREIPDENYEKELLDIFPQCSEAYFVMCEHVLKFSPGWNNDKLLVLVKK